MTREIALRFVNAMVAGDLATVGSMLAKDVVWNLPPFAKQPPVCGRDAVLNFVRDTPSTYYQAGTLRLEPALVVADSGGAVVLGTLRGRTVRGKDYENFYSFGLRFAAGEVVEGWELVDTANFVQQMR